MTQTSDQSSADGRIRPIRNLGFIHIVPFGRGEGGARQGLADAIELFEHAEALGLDSGWVRTRHLQRGLPSPAVLFGALAQRTRRIQLGSAVIPVGHENPFRLAEDLAVADVLSGGRLQPGLSVHPPRYDDALNDLVFDGGWRAEDYSYARIERLRSFLRGDRIREAPPYEGIGGDIDSERVEPHAPGLADRLWYGGGSLASARWAGQAGLGWLVSNISTSEDGIVDFADAQRNQIDAYRASHAAGEGSPVAVARVIVPTEGASPKRAAKYRAYVEARTPRTRRVHGNNTIIALDVLGSADEIAERIRDDRAFQAADDYLFELPFEFELADWKQMLTALATTVGPALGWTPKA